MRALRELVDEVGEAGSGSRLMIWVFRDVVFQGVGFQATIFRTPHPYQL